MRLITIVALLLIILTFLLPYLSGSVVVPTSVSATEVGVFVGGITGYWIEVAKVAYGGL